jgi:hypothetical protein
MGRSKDEVEYWMVPKLMAFIQENRRDEFMEDSVALARSVRHSIRRSEMLCKNEAKWLEDWLEESLTDEIAGITGEGEYIAELNILKIDSLSIYADAWAIWCRPGSYTV